jgi:hypothetical protein
MLKQPYQIETTHLKLSGLLYGQPGSWKSTTALSMPNPVLIDADNGVHRINIRHRVPTLQVNSYQEVLDLIASSEIKPFETIVVDTVGRLLDYIDVHIIKENPKNGQAGGQLSLKGWGVRAATFSAFIKTVLTMGKHILFVAHEREDKDGDTKIIRPDFGGGKAGSELIKDLDFVGYMEMIGREHTISFAPTDRYYAKNSAKLDDVLKIPYMKDGDPNNFMIGIVSRFKDAVDRETEQLKEYAVLMEQVKASIDGVVNAETANVFVDEMKNGKIPDIWDSRMKSRAMFGERVKTLGLHYDTESKAYVETVAAA